MKEFGYTIEKGEEGEKAKKTTHEDIVGWTHGYNNPGKRKKGV